MMKTDIENLGQANAQLVEYYLRRAQKLQAETLAGYAAAAYRALTAWLSALRQSIRSLAHIGPSGRRPV